MCLRRTRKDRIKLQTAAKIYAFFSLPQIEIAHLVLRLLKISSPYTIAVDRTEWQLGKTWVNVLMLSVTYRQVAIPVLWTVLSKKGCSDNQERQELLERFAADFGLESIGFVTADREFCSKQWLGYLVGRRIGFRLRIKANARIANARGKLVSAARLCRTMKTGARVEFRKKRKLWGATVYVAVCRKPDGENVIVIASQQTGKILNEYGERWKIETLFGILKTRGFRLEDTHLTQIERVGKLLSLLTIAVSWALLTGELESCGKTLKTKKHGYLAKSIFRLGFDCLRNCFCQIITNIRQKQRFKQLTLLLSCS